jgi:NhaP-type Na+/H+ or K+/H+ antiporter
MDKPALYFASVLALGIAAQWLAWRVKVPAIVMLLGCGFVARFALGPPQQFVAPEVMYPLVSLAVAVILFEGGMTLRFRDIRDTHGVVLRLVTIGLVVTWALTALAAYWLLDFSLPLATLLGAVLTVSGPTVIGPMIRNIRLARRIGSIVKWEGIVNDPIGAILAALVFNGLFLGTTDGMDSLRDLCAAMLIGTVIGGSAAFVIVQILRRYWVPDYLQNAVVLAIVVASFAISNHFQRDSGLVTVTLLGVALANQQRVVVRNVMQFKEKLSVLLISTLFIVLASNVDIDWPLINSFGWRAIVFLALLIVVVRPLAVLVATAGSELSKQERLVLACLHPRGIVGAAVVSLLALDISNVGHEHQADRFLMVAFLTIVTTVVVYGIAVPPLARRLGLASPNPQGLLIAGASPLVRDIAAAINDEGIPITIVDTNHENAVAARLAGLSVHFASIASDYIREEIDLNDIGHLLAMTPNDEVNTLAVLEFADEFGQAHVYQLVIAETTHQRRDRVPMHRRGRTLFHPEATYDELTKRHANGAKIKKTQLTPDFTFAHFLDHHGANAVVLFVIDGNGRLVVHTSDGAAPHKGHLKVIALVDAAEPAAAGTAAEG